MNARLDASSFDELDAAMARWCRELTDRGLIVTDEQLVVRRWNQWLAAQTGRAEADAVGVPLFELYPMLVERGFDRYYEDALAGEARILSERLHKHLLPISRNFHGAGMTEMAQSARIEPLVDVHGVIRGTVTLIEDVTERVVTERELRNQIAASEQARRIAEDASRLKDEFLATLSHEIRTPLNAVIGWTRILRLQRPVKSQAHALEVIERNAHSQLRLVEDLLDMARIITGKLHLESEVLSLEPIARAALDVVAPAADAKRVTIEALFEPDLPAVSGDSDRLQQVVWNLLSNAVKFTPAGGHVRLEARREQSSIRLTVFDDGQGIGGDFLPYVFDRFRQADATASRRHGGLGLSLALVRQIMELHGGTVGVASEGPDKGSSFWFTLPVARTVGEELPEVEAPDAPHTLDGVSILIVDDDADARELLTVLLQYYEATVRSVASANEALELLREPQYEPDVLVSDVGMPGTDGYDLIREVRTLPSETKRRLPAIAVTAYTNPDDRVRALVAGYQTHISKPVDASALAAAILNLVSPRASR